MGKGNDKKIVLFDGVCNLCNGLVQFIIKRDRQDQFRFAALQSEKGRTLLAQHGLPVDQFDSIVLITGDEYFIKSMAALRIFKELKVYKGLWWFRYLPQKLRDFGYDIVARNRYKWFGKKSSCMLPTPELQAKFLE